MIGKPSDRPLISRSIMAELRRAGAIEYLIENDAHHTEVARAHFARKEALAKEAAERRHEEDHQ